jgi:hypothetical protein
MFKKILIAFVIISSLSLYNLIFIPESIIKYFEFGVPLAMLLVVMVYGIYDKSFKFKHLFRPEVSLVFLAVVISMFAAYYFHKQKFIITAVTQRFIYFFIGYAFLHVLKPKPEELIRMIVYFGVIYIVFYFLQTFLYPTLLFRTRIASERETLRIFINGSAYLFLAYIICLALFLQTFHYRFFILCMFALIIFVLLGTRQVIAPAAIVSILMILLSRKIKTKFVTIILLLLMAIPIYYLFKDIFISMFEVSQKQVSNYSQDVRYRAAIFYLFEFFPNKLAYLIGNGVPSANSPYGLKVNSFQSVLGYYQADIGIIGDYAKFGILVVIAEISMFVRVMFFKLPEELRFIKYYILVLIMTIFISGGSFSYAENIMILCILLYIIDVSKFTESPESLKTADLDPITKES